MKGDEIFDFFKLGVGVFRKIVQMRKKRFKGRCYDTGEQLVFARKMIIDHRFGDAGLFRDLQGGGTVKALFGE